MLKQKPTSRRSTTTSNWKTDKSVFDLGKSLNCRVLMLPTEVASPRVKQSRTVAVLKPFEDICNSAYLLK
jgi:hypothetical protein